MSKQVSIVSFFVLSFLFGVDLQAQRDGMPRENVVDAPAIADGLCVSNVFQSNMVLQRDKPVHVWGWAEPGATIVVEFAGQTAKCNAEKKRRWQVTLPAMPANVTPQLMKISNGAETLTLKNILIGDVWVLGGQSNMEFPLDRVENGQLEIVSANYPNIRILTVPAANGPDPKPGFERLHEWSDWFGRHFRKGDWDECTPEIARELSAIGFVFARRVHMASQVPIGVIDASRGGTTVETWTPARILETLESPRVGSLLQDWEKRIENWSAEEDLAQRVKRFQQRVERFKKEGQKLPPNEKEPTDLKPGPAMDQNRPGNCYASMIHPLAGLSVKGAIFHQGYNNCFNGTEGTVMYREVFPEMIAAWRKAFNDPEMPFGILSLCTEGPVQTLENYSEMLANPGPFLREAQYRTYLALKESGDKNVGFVSTYDMRRRWYHPQLKIPAGERIARWALATQYGMGGRIKWQPPEVKEMTLDGATIVLKFDQPVSGVDNGGPILGFGIAAENGQFHPADAAHVIVGEDNRGRPRQDQTQLVLSSPMVSKPVHFRYAWGRSPLGNLQASRNSDIPVATQRSDNWTLENTPSGVFDQPVSGKLSRKQNNQLKQALQELDRQRLQNTER